MVRNFLATNDPILSVGESAVIELGVDGKESSAATNPGEMPEEGENLVLSGGSHAGNATNGPGGEKPAGDTHTVAIRDVTAASKQNSSTGMGRSVHGPTTSRDLAVSMRPRTARVPLNISVLGDI